MQFRPSLVVGLITLFASIAPATADPVEVHYAPVENLEHVDVALLQSARSKIDLTAFSLTDWPVIDALADAAPPRRCGSCRPRSFRATCSGSSDRGLRRHSNEASRPLHAFEIIFRRRCFVALRFSQPDSILNSSSKTTTSSLSVSQRLLAPSTRVSSRYGQQRNRLRRSTQLPHRQRVGQN